MTENHVGKIPLEGEPQNHPIKKQWGILIWGFEEEKEAREYREGIFNISPQHLSTAIELENTIEETKKWCDWDCVECHEDCANYGLDDVCEYLLDMRVRRVSTLQTEFYDVR